MNALEILKHDHEKVAMLLDQACETTERAEKTREKLLQQIKSELKIHEEIEEKVFYPFLKQFKEEKELILEAYEEHHMVDVLLSELEETDTEREEWKAKMTVLKEMIKHHVNEEEGQIFPLVKELVSKEELDALTQKMIELKKQLI